MIAGVFVSDQISARRPGGRVARASHSPALLVVIATAPHQAVLVHFGHKTMDFLSCQMRRGIGGAGWEVALGERGDGAAGAGEDDLHRHLAPDAARAFEPGVLGEGVLGEGVLGEGGGAGRGADEDVGAVALGLQLAAGLGG